MRTNTLRTKTHNSQQHTLISWWTVVVLFLIVGGDDRVVDFCRRGRRQPLFSKCEHKCQSINVVVVVVIDGAIFVKKLLVRYSGGAGAVDLILVHGQLNAYVQWWCRCNIDVG